MAKKANAVAPKRGYGWVADLPDQRDQLYAAPVAAVAKLPAKVDLRKQCPPVYDQGQLGSCTGNGVAAAYQFDLMKQKLANPFAPSRLFIYYNERKMEGTIDSDSGAQIRDGIKSVGEVGVCAEGTWPYDIAQFRTAPSAAAYTEAAQHKAVLYQRVARSLSQMQGCLASGYPWVLGFTVYESFESAAVAQSGVVPLPGPGEKVLGGHCVVAVGYDSTQHTFLCRNSWGTGWGMKGYFTMPFSYLLDGNLSDDFWTIRLVQ